MFDETCHRSRDCFYTKGNNKGKGKSGKAWKDGRLECHNCGGDDFARDCTSSKKLLSHVVESGKTRETRKAKARTRACSQWKAILGVRSGDMKVNSGRSLSENQIQKFGRLRQTMPSLQCLERSTSILHLVTRRDSLVPYNTRARVGSSSTPTREQLRQLYLLVSSSLREVRTFPTSAEPCFRQWTHSRRNRVAEGLRREYHRLCQLHRYHGIMPLCRERRWYNYSLKRAGTLKMAPMEPNQDIVMNE